MTKKIFFSFLFVFLFSIFSNVWAGTCTIVLISPGSNELITGTYTQAELETCAGGSLTGLTINADTTLTLSDAVTVNGNVNINGTLTHETENPIGLQLTATNITVNNGGSINLEGKGCRGSDNGDGFYAMGPDPNSGNTCVYRATGAGGYQYGGGNHGGLGGSTIAVYTPQTYDSQTTPAMLGSGGGGAPAGAGYGGGLATLNISGTLTLNGNLDADGQNGGGSQSGGSGGSILIYTNTLAGSGSVTANGGNGDGYGGGGGGGRIAIYYNTLSNFDLSQVSANGGTGGWISSEKGTTFLLDRQTDDGSGTLTITSGLKFLDGDDYTRTSFYIYGDAYLQCEDQTTLNISTTGSYTDLGSSWTCSSNITTVNLTVGTSLNVTDMNWNFSATDHFNLTAPTLNISGTSVYTLSQAGAQANWNISNDITLTNFNYSGPTAGSESYQGGVLFIDDPINISLINSNINSSVSWIGIASLSIDEDSSINASGKGCSGANDNPYLEGHGPNLLDSNYACAAGGTTGVEGAGRGKYGGAGHCSAGTASYGPASGTYDNYIAPFLPGSGGAGVTYYGGGIGYGGGTVRISITGDLTLEGSINASAGSAGYAQGGGSGGSIWINGSTISGYGYMYSNGVSGNGYGGAGGAGYIALYYDTLNNFSEAQLQSNGSTVTENCTPYTSLNPDLDISPTSGLVTTESGGTTTFTLALQTQPSAPVTVTLSSSNTSEGTVEPSILIFPISDWNIPQTVTITGVDDSSDDGDTTFTINITTSSSDNFYDNLAESVSVTNTDNDSSGGGGGDNGGGDDSGTPSLELEIQGPENNPDIGDSATYIITVSNTGNGDAENTLLQITLPDSLEFISAEIADNIETSLIALSTQSSCSAQNQIVSCSLGTLSAGQSTQVTLNTQVIRSGSLEIEVQVESEGSSSEGSGGTGSQAIESRVQGGCSLSNQNLNQASIWNGYWLWAIGFLMLRKKIKLQ